MSTRKPSRRPKHSAHADTEPAPAPANWADLLKLAVEQPGTIHAAYSAFHNYSFGNQLLAAMQCYQRGLRLGPIATFKGWQDKGRQVRKGERALQLCRPAATIRRKWEDEQGDEHVIVIPTRFVYPRAWFVVAQTDGELEPEVPDLPAWHLSVALTALAITRQPFVNPNGNMQGYSLPAKRTIHINPVAFNPTKTAIHEMAHVLLHAKDTDEQNGALREVEAEAVALLLLDALDLPGAEHARGYIQGWYGRGKDIPEDNARRILNAATKILEAGRPASIPASDALAA